MLLLWYGIETLLGGADTYWTVSSAGPDVLDMYVDGALIGRFTSA